MHGGGEELGAGGFDLAEFGFPYVAQGQRLGDRYFLTVISHSCQRSSKILRKRSYLSCRSRRASPSTPASFRMMSSIDLMVAELRAIERCSVLSVQKQQVTTPLIFRDEGEFGVAFGHGGIERGKFAATLIAAHGNEKFVGEISTATNGCQ